MNLLVYFKLSSKKLNPYIKTIDIKIVEKIIFKTLFVKFLLNIKKLFLYKRIVYAITPHQVEIDVAIGIIINPIVLNKLKLIRTFIVTTKTER